MNNEHPPRSSIFDRLRTSGFNRHDSQWLGGVAAGLATRYKVDVVLVRGAFVALSLLAGFGLIVYALAWALLPDGSGKIHLEHVINDKEWTSALTGSAILLGVGIFVAPWLLSTVAPVLWPILIIAGIAFVIFSRRNTKYAAAPRPAKTQRPEPREAATGSVIEVAWRDHHEVPFNATGPASPTKPKENPVEPDPSGAGQDSRYTAPYTDYFAAKAAKKLRHAPPLPGWVSTILVGATIVLIAVILLLDYLKLVELPGNGWSVALAAGLFLVGLSLVFAALSYRTSGGLLGLAIPLLVLTLVFSSSDFNNEKDGFLKPGDSAQQYDAVFSNSTIDLRSLSNTNGPTTVNIDSVFSKLELALPWNVPVNIVTDGVFLSATDAKLPQDSVNFPEGTPAITVKIDGVFSSINTTLSEPGLPINNSDF